MRPSTIVIMTGLIIYTLLTAITQVAVNNPSLIILAKQGTLLLVAFYAALAAYILANNLDSRISFHWHILYEQVKKDAEERRRKRKKK